MKQWLLLKRVSSLVCVRASWTKHYGFFFNLMPEFALFPKVFRSKFPEPILSTDEPILVL